MSRSCIRHLRSAYQSGHLSVQDVWHLFVKRIQADRSAYAAGLSISSLNISPTNAFVSTVNSMTPPLATIDKAQCKQLPILHGIPIGVKDNFCTDVDTFGVPTTCASKALSAFASVYNAAVVDHLLEAGALLLGKTNMDEFAMGCGSTDGAVAGPVVNPWSCTQCHRDTAHIAGGSSGGSAAAVAAGLCVAALASDTGGSARLPAGFCGIVGLKPTYSLLSRHGLIPLVNSLDVPALMAGSAADVSVLLSMCLRAGSGGSATTARHSDATCYPLKPDQLTKLLEGLEQVFVGEMQSLYKRPLRIGIPVEYHAPGLTGEVAEVWDRVAGWLQDELACSVRTVRLPHTPMATTVYSVLCAVEVASNMSRYDGLRYGFRATSSSQGGGDLATGSDALFAATRSQGFGEVVRSRIFAGNYFLLREQQRAGGHLDMARRLWRLIKEDFDCVFNQVDLLLTPVTLGTAPRMAEFRQFDNRTRTTLDDVCTVAVNLAGLPAVAFPVTLSASLGLPIGLQLIGPNLAEPDLLALADWITERGDFQPLVDVTQLITAF